MKRFTLGLGVMVAGLALVASPALAQRPNDSGAPPSGARAGSGGGGNSGGGGGGGTAVPRGSAPASASIPSSGGSGMASGSVSSPSAPAAAAPSMRAGSAAAPRQAAPAHRTGAWQASPAQTRYAGGQRVATGVAVPRNESAAIAGTGARTPNHPEDTRAVPSWARPRGNNPATDTATPRTSNTPRPAPGNRNAFVYVYPGFSYCYTCSAFGAYDYYDPFYGSVYGPMFGYGMGMGLGGYPIFDPGFDNMSGDPYDYGVGSYSSSQYSSHEEGNLKLKVKPRSAKVYVDGYYVGLVDEFDGAFQKLPLTAGRHHVKIDADGYESAEFDAVITPDHTVTFQGTLKKVQ